MSYETFNEFSAPATAPAPCAGAGACQTLFRTLFGSCYDTGETLAGSQNMINWLNAFNFDDPNYTDPVSGQKLGAIRWGTTRYANFAKSTDVTPTYGVSDVGNGGLSYSRTDFWFSTGDLEYSSYSDVCLTQVWLGGARSYMVLATGFTVPDGRQISVEGCTMNVPKNPGCMASGIVHLPIPTWALGDHCMAYIFGLVGPNPLGGLTGTYTGLDQMEKVNINNRAPSFDVNQKCAAASGDPFQ